MKLHVQNTAHIVHQVAHYEIDLGLIEGDCSHPDIEVQTWVEDELVVFCAPQHHLAKRGVASMDELTHEAWILREQGSGTRLTFDQAMRHHRSALNIRLELEHTETIKRAVESGLGIGCISGWHCATHSAVAAWCQWKPRTWTWPGSSTSSGINRSTRPRQCASSWNCAALSPPGFSAATRSCCRALPEG